MTICHMRIACWITKATNTYSVYVILNAFPLQQYLHKRALMLHFTYVACLATDFSILILISYIYIQWITGYRPKTGSHRKSSYARQVFLHHKQLHMFNICPKMSFEVL